MSHVAASAQIIEYWDYRKAMGMSQEAFADHAGIHRTYISDIERGVRNPTIEIVERLAKGLGVRPGQLLD